MKNREVLQMYKHPVIDVTGFESSNNNWSDQYIIKYLLLNKNTLVKELKAAGLDIDRSEAMSLCIKLEDASKVDCPCVPPKDCVWKKSINKLPSLTSEITVTNLTGDVVYSYVNFDKVREVVNSRVPSVRDSKVYTIKNGYLILPTDFLIEAVQITAIFADNYEAIVSSCNVTSEIKCNPLDVLFSPDYDLVSKVVARAWQMLPQVRNMAPADVLNNSQLDTISNQTST